MYPTWPEQHLLLPKSCTNSNYLPPEAFFPAQIFGVNFFFLGLILRPTYQHWVSDHYSSTPWFTHNQQDISQMLKICGPFYDQHRSNLSVVQEYKGNLNFATDTWMLPNHQAFVTVTVYLEQKGIPLCLVLDVVEAAKSHSGYNLAMTFTNILQEFRIANKISTIATKHQPKLTLVIQILSITCDNTSCNNVIIEELVRTLPNFSEVNQTWCFLHIINLSAKSIIRQFDISVRRITRCANQHLNHYTKMLQY
jgi:hypothetical protein